MDPQSGAETPDEIAEEASAPACILSFNASDASGAGGIAGDVATIAAMGAHALPVVTAVLMRDTDEKRQPAQCEDGAKKGAATIAGAGTQKARSDGKRGNAQPQVIDDAAAVDDAAR